MPKSIEDIIVPEKKRSIRDIPIPEGRRRNSVLQNNFDTRPEEERFSRVSARVPRKGMWLATSLALLVLIFAILSLFDGSTLAYIPKSLAVSFNNDIYTARKTGEGELLYSVIKLSQDKGLEVPASGEEEVNRKASGTIVVYNDASSEPQRLIENTRFETPSGLIYRIPKAIVIPGRKTVNGDRQPGSIETPVFADEAGEKYNLGLTDFTVPGLKGTARFSTIYARSKTGMSGGFVGMEKVVLDQDRVQAQTELGTALRDELTLEAKAQVPDDFILLSSLSSLTFEDLPQSSTSSEGHAVINMRGNLQGVMFKKNDLSKHLALKKNSITSGESVDIINLDSLSFSFIGTRPTDLLFADEINFSVTGETMFVWRTDEVALKADLVGKRKRDVPSILNNYPTITKATATIRPFWRSVFPDDSASISIKKLPVK